MMRLTRWSVWMALGLCLVTGCAAHQRESYQRDRAAEHVYKQPLSEIWPRVKAALDDEGYYWDEASEGFMLETDWKQTDRGGTLGHSYMRLLVEGTELKGGGASLRVLRKDVSERPVLVSPSGREVVTGSQTAMIDATRHGYSIQMEVWKRADRDLEMEWKLLRAIDPEAAAALEKDAEAKFPK